MCVYVAAGRRWKEVGKGGKEIGRAEERWEGERERRKVGKAKRRLIRVRILNKSEKKGREDDGRIKKGGVLWYWEKVRGKWKGEENEIWAKVKAYLKRNGGRNNLSVGKIGGREERRKQILVRE